QSAPRHTETADSKRSLPARRPARMIRRRTGFVGSLVRPVHCLKSSTSRGSVSGAPSMSFATTFQGQNDGEAKTLPNRAGSDMARVSVILLGRLHHNPLRGPVR